MTSCSFCGSEIPAGTGKLFIKRDASQYHFCSSKCQRNQIGLGRTARHTKWTQAHAKAKEEAKHAKSVSAKAPVAKPAKEKAAKPKEAKAVKANA